MKRSESKWSKTPIIQKMEDIPMQFFYKALPWLIVAVMVIIVSIQMKGKDKKDDDHPKREEY